MILCMWRCICAGLGTLRGFFSQSTTIPKWESVSLISEKWRVQLFEDNRTFTLILMGRAVLNTWANPGEGGKKNIFSRKDRNLLMDQLGPTK